MVRGARTFNFGRLGVEPEIERALEQMYRELAIEISFKVSKRVIAGTNAPASSPVNKNFEIGDMWIRSDTNAVWVMTSRTSDEAVTWTAV